MLNSAPFAVGIQTDGKSVMEIAGDLGDVFYADFGSRKSAAAWASLRW